MTRFHPTNLIMEKFELFSSFNEASRRAKELVETHNELVKIQRQSTDGFFKLTWSPSVNPTTSTHTGKIWRELETLNRDLSSFQLPLLTSLRSGKLSSSQLDRVFDNLEAYQFNDDQLEELKVAKKAFSEAGAHSTTCYFCLGDGGPCGRCFACGGTGFTP